MMAQLTVLSAISICRTRMPSLSPSLDRIDAPGSAQNGLLPFQTFSQQVFLSACSPCCNVTCTIDWMFFSRFITCLIHTSLVALATNVTISLYLTFFDLRARHSMRQNIHFQSRLDSEAGCLVHSMAYTRACKCQFSGGVSSNDFFFGMAWSGACCLQGQQCILALICLPLSA